MYNNKLLITIGIIILGVASFYSISKIVNENETNGNNEINENIKLVGLEDHYGLVFDRSDLQSFNESEGAVIDSDLFSEYESITYPYITLDIPEASRFNNYFENRIDLISNLLGEVDEERGDFFSVHYQAYVENEILFVTVFTEFKIDDVYNTWVVTPAIDYRQDNTILRFKDILDEISYDGDIHQKGLSLLYDKLDDIEDEEVRTRISDYSEETWLRLVSNNDAFARIKNGNLELFINIQDEENRVYTFEKFVVTPSEFNNN